MGDYERALDDADDAILLDPANPEAYRVRAYLGIKVGACIRCPGGRQRGYANGAGLLRRLSLARIAVYLALEQYDNAITDARARSTWRRRAVFGYNARAWAYAKAGQYEKALEDANRSIELDDECAECYDTRSLAQLGLGNLNEAESDADRALQLSDQCELGLRGPRQGLPGQEPARCGAGRRQRGGGSPGPNERDVYSIRAQIYRAMGRTSEANRDEARKEAALVLD